MDIEYVKEYVNSLLVVKDRWYHKVPLIGKRIYKKQKIKKYQANKFKLFDFIHKTVNEELLKDKICEDIYFDSLIKESSVNEQFLEKKRSYLKPNWCEIIDNLNTGGN